MFKKISLSLILFFINILNINAYSDTIDKIEMNIFIDDYGTAEVTEVWTTEVASGTENYKVYQNLETSKIYDFTVTDETGITYQFLEDWDLNASREQKKYKNGIVNTANGVELCWGVGDFGNRVYTLNYKISNFVQEYNDAGAIYFGLISYDMNPTPKDFEITITSNYDFKEVEAKVWAYGYEGIADIIDGKIVLKEPNNFVSSDYVVLLVELPKGLFKTSDYINDSFDNLFDKAEQGVISNSELNPILDILAVIFAFLINILFIVLVFMLASIDNKKRAKKIRLPKWSSANYFRDIPCQKDIFKAYVIGKESGLVTTDSNLIGAVLLKWLKEKKITFVQHEPGLLSKKEKNVIDLSQPFYSDNAYETELHNMLLEAAKDNKLLESKEFSKWYTRKYGTIHKWFRNIEGNVKNNFKNEGLITEKTEKSLKVIPYKVEVYSRELKQEAINFQGLKKFLKEFTSIDEKKIITVHLWEEYLIFAQLLGIAKEVAKEFKKLYPEIVEMSDLNTNNINNIIVYNDIIRTTERRISARRSSGGGGFSSSGGGGGSRGGGGGGGRR
mgnify:CR=1 FL=1